MSAIRRFAALVLAAAAPLAFAQDGAKPAAGLDGSAYFPSSSSSLTADAYEQLRAVAEQMRADPTLRIEIEGHSDTSASAATNEPLAQQRADVAREFLLSLGIEPARVVAKGYGAWRPVNDNATLEQRAWNRRVQFRRLER